MSTRLLIAESPLQVLPTLARRIGLHEAIVLQQIHFLALKTDDGWVQKTVDEWAAAFCFMSERSVIRAFTNLRRLELLISEMVTVSGGRSSRVRINHDAPDLADADGVHPVKGSRQDGVTICVTGQAKMALRSSQDGVTPSCNEETTEFKAEQTASQSVARNATTSILTVGDVDTVWTAWTDVTQPKGAAVLSPKRRRIIAKALDSHGLADCLDAVRGWQHSAHHRGKNKDQRIYNSIELLLRDAEHIEMFRDLQRRHGGGGSVAGDCPGPTPPAPIAAMWAPIAAQLEQLIPDTQREIWLSTLHLHGDHDDGLVVGVAPEVCAWVGDRFFRAITQAAGGRKVTIVQCDMKAAAA